MREYIAEVVPEHLYQRGNFLAWPWQRKRSFLEKYRITVVVNLWGKVDSDLEGMKYIVWPLRSDDDPGGVDGLLTLLHGLLDAGERLLIHCEAGVNRSVWLCGKLLRRWQGLTGKQAADRLAATVQRAKINPRLLRDLYQ